MTPNIPDFVQTEDKSYIRDTKNRALLQTDRAALARHRAGVLKRDAAQQQLHILRTEMSELRTLVHQLLHR